MIHTGLICFPVEKYIVHLFFKFLRQFSQNIEMEEKNLSFFFLKLLTFFLKLNFFLTRIVNLDPD